MLFNGIAARIPVFPPLDLTLQVVIGWKLGVVESVCSSIVAGLSVDYVVHFAMAYVEVSHPYFCVEYSHVHHIDQVGSRRWR